MQAQIKVGVLVINKEGRVLLIKEKHSGMSRAKWNIIKGTYENTRETIFEAAVRECQEEASITVELTHAIGVCLYDGEGKEPRIQFNFLAKVKNDRAVVPDKHHQKLRDEDIREVRWFKKEELTSLKEADYVSKIAHRVVQGWLKDGKRYPLEIYSQPYQAIKDSK